MIMNAKKKPDLNGLYNKSDSVRGAYDKFTDLKLS